VDERAAFAVVPDPIDRVLLAHLLRKRLEQEV